VDQSRDEWESEWLGADKPMHPALLMVYLDSVANLPVSFVFIINILIYLRLNNNKIATISVSKIQPGAIAIC
jgi:hypothetical protein